MSSINMLNFNKILLILIAVIFIFLLTGCNNVLNSNTYEKTYTCREDYRSVSSFLIKDDYIVGITDNKLSSLIVIQYNKYNDAKKYEQLCLHDKNNAEEINAKNTYVKEFVECDDKNKIVTIKFNYDITKSLEYEGTKNMLSHTLDYIIKDGIFDLDNWKKSMTKNGMTCD